MQLKYLILNVAFSFATLCSFAQENRPVLSESSAAGTATVFTTPPEAATIAVPNNVRLYAPLLPINDAALITASSPATQVKQQIVYSDGSNVPFQVISQNNSNVNGQLKNLIEVSDNRVQQNQFSYLPYASGNANFQTNAFQAQRNYYASQYPNEGYTSFSQSMVISNGAQRADISFMPGKSQVGETRGTITKKITNNTNEVVIWGLDATNKPIAQGYYKINELLGVEVIQPSAASGTGISAQAPKSRAYKDRDGKLILKMEADSVYTSSGLLTQVVTTWKKTYYVYGEKGELLYTLPPKLVQLYEANNGTFTPTAINNLSFQYQYDAKGRAIAVRKPGETQFSRSIYDRKDRVVMTQAPNGSNGQWQVSFYDANNRIKATSTFYDNAPGHNQTWIQAQIDNWTGVNTSSLFYYLGSADAEYITPPQLGIAGNNMDSYFWFDNYNAVDADNAIWNSYGNTLQFNELLSTPGAETPVRSLRTEGRVTGSKVRIQHPPLTVNADPWKFDDWRSTAIYYDDKGRVIYTVSKDINNYDEVQGTTHRHFTGVQYDFAGRTLISKHIAINIRSQGSYQHTEWNKNEYDAATGKLIRTYHKLDNSAWAIQSSLAYDDLGRVKRKTIGDNGEVQDFTYTIDGKLQGINKVYAETGNKEGTSKTFGESLKYDYGFKQARYDGKIAGIIWRGGAAANMYAYGYDYTLDGSLKRADFNAYDGTTASWLHNTLDYSVNAVNYDKNGNILKMNQRGMDPFTGPVDMDKMTYTYEAGGISNHIQNISDAITTNYNLGDFQDVAGVTDYSYDAAGNLTSDKNKGILSASYDIYNKPTSLSISNAQGTGGIVYSYDVTGAKVMEISQIGTEITYTEYLGNFVYVNNKLRYVLTPEGRTLINSQPNVPVKEEYFVKDHLGNIRSVINIVSFDIKQYLADFELASAHLENLVFDHIDEVRDLKPDATPENSMAANLNGANPDQRIGTSLLLHVMAGDKVALNVKNYYNGYLAKDDKPIDGNAMMNAVVGALTGGAGGFAGSESHNVDLVQKMINTNSYNTFNTIVNAQTDATKPRAYLNYILFDENMRLVKQMTGSFQANGDGAWSDIGTTSSLEIPQNGYLVVYLSNSSRRLSCLTCSSVYFDKLKVQLTRGNLIEENHYYPFGLPMAGMSSLINPQGPVEGLSTEEEAVKNRRKYQGSEYNKTLGLNWMDFNARQYDPQIGRFLGVDPLADDEEQDMFSPYAAMGNMPEGCIDPDGMQYFQAANTTGGMNDGSGAGSGGDHGTRNSLVFDFGGGGNGFSYMGMSGAILGSYYYTHKAEREMIMGQYLGSGRAVVNFYDNLNGSLCGLGTGEGVIPDNAVKVSDDGTVSTYHWWTGDNADNLQENYGSALNAPPPPPDESKGIGQPGFGESLIPVWGSGRAAIDDFQNGRWGWGVFNTAMAVSDLFLVKSLYTGLAKGGLKLVGSSSWAATRKYYLKTGFAEANKPLHHWLIHQRGSFGKYVPNAIKNQMWNLKLFGTTSMHMRAGHGVTWLGEKGYGLFGRLWFGTPAWPKYVIGSYGGRAIEGAAD